MKIDWLVADVTAVGSLDRAERAILGVILGVFFANLGHICSPGATLWVILAGRVFCQSRSCLLSGAHFVV